MSNDRAAGVKRGRGSVVQLTFGDGDAALLEQVVKVFEAWKGESLPSTAPLPTSADFTRHLLGLAVDRFEGMQAGAGLPARPAGVLKPEELARRVDGIYAQLEADHWKQHPRPLLGGESVEGFPDIYEPHEPFEPFFASYRRGGFPSVARVEWLRDELQVIRAAGDHIVQRMKPTPGGPALPRDRREAFLMVETPEDWWMGAADLPWVVWYWMVEQGQLGRDDVSQRSPGMSEPWAHVPDHLRQLVTFHVQARAYVNAAAFDAF